MRTGQREEQGEERSGSDRCRRRPPQARHSRCGPCGTIVLLAGPRRRPREGGEWRTVTTARGLAATRPVLFRAVCAFGCVVTLCRRSWKWPRPGHGATHHTAAAHDAAAVAAGSCLSCSRSAGPLVPLPPCPCQQGAGSLALCPFVIAFTSHAWTKTKQVRAQKVGHRVEIFQGGTKSKHQAQAVQLSKRAGAGQLRALVVSGCGKIQQGRRSVACRAGAMGSAVA